MRSFLNFIGDDGYVVNAGRAKRPNRHGRDSQFYIKGPVFSTKKSTRKATLGLAKELTILVD
jgi:hypothetical protein